MKQLLLFFLLSFFIVTGAVFLNNYQKNRPVQKTKIITPAPTEKIIVTPTTVGAKKTVSLELIGVSDGMTVNESPLLIKGKTTPDADVFVDNEELKAGKNGEFSVKVSLDEGENIIVVTVNDEEGSMTEKELTVNLETNE